jgi:hypothetical protein
MLASNHKLGIVKLIVSMKFDDQRALQVTSFWLSNLNKRIISGLSSNTKSFSGLYHSLRGSFFNHSLKPVALSHVFKINKDEY